MQLLVLELFILAAELLSPCVRSTQLDPCSAGCHVGPELHNGPAHLGGSLKNLTEDQPSCCGDRGTVGACSHPGQGYKEDWAQS